MTTPSPLVRRPELAGAACGIEWVTEETRIVSDRHFDPPLRTDRRPHADPALVGLVMTDRSVGLGQQLPLWPNTCAGLRLRALYLGAGERALCEPAADRSAWWIEEDDDRW